MSKSDLTLSAPVILGVSLGPCSEKRARERHGQAVAQDASQTPRRASKVLGVDLPSSSSLPRFYP